MPSHSAERAQAWIDENGSHHSTPPIYAPVTLDVTLDWLTAHMSRAADEIGVQPVPQQTVIMGNATFGPTVVTMPKR